MKKQVLQTIIGSVITAAGLAAVILTRSQALAEGAGDGEKLLFAFSLIALIIGVVVIVTAYAKPARKTDVMTLTLAAMMAALCYVAFAFFKIDIPVGTEKTAFHLGNTFCVLASLFLGGLWGGLSGAVGMTIGDFFGGYVTSAPKTFLLKLGIGLVTGLIAHKVLKIDEEKDWKKVTWKSAVAASCGMAFNVVAEPLFGYVYKRYLFGLEQNIASTLAKIGAGTTLVNAVIAVIAATVFYLALRPVLTRIRKEKS